MATMLQRAIKADGHTRAWYEQRLGVPYWKLYRLLEGKRLFEYTLARDFAALLRRPFDELFMPAPVKDGRRWVLRFAARSVGAEGPARPIADQADVA